MIQPGYYQSINTRIPLIDRSENIMYHGIVKILRHDRNMGIFRTDPYGVRNISLEMEGIIGK